MDGKSIPELLADMEDMLAGRGRHADHTQEKVGRCVYCSCGDRAQPIPGWKPKNPPVKKSSPRKRMFEVRLADGFICYRTDTLEKAEEMAKKHPGSEIV